MRERYDTIAKLRREKDAIILAHYYQTMDIQNIADHVGDSFALAQEAQKAKEKVIVLCGVRFMAESAKILNPEKTVLLPAIDAGCPMADMATPEDIDRLRTAHPDAAVMCYVNSSAKVKAKSDICCTSSSALRVARSLKEKRIIFIPDQNLGIYTAKQVPEKEFIFFDGYCPIHHRVSENDVETAKKAHPDALLAVHPECTPAVQESADYIGSTAGILHYVASSPAKKFIIGTELGVVERLAQTAPDKEVYLLSPRLLCTNMKKTRLEDIIDCLENNVHEMVLPENIRLAAYKSLDRMMKA